MDWFIQEASCRDHKQIIFLYMDFSYVSGASTLFQAEISQLLIAMK